MGIAQRSLWEKYRGQGRMPPKWTQADSDVIADHRTAMYQAFPEFTLCDGHWKLRRFASDNYLSWYRKHRSVGVNASDQTPSSEGDEDLQQESHVVRVPKRAWPTVPSLAMLRRFKRSKSCGTSQYPTTSQPSCASLIDVAMPARSSTSTPSPSAPVPDVDDMVLGSADNASVQVTPINCASTSTPSICQVPGQEAHLRTSILHDIQRRQALLTKLSLNEQAKAPESPSPDVPVAMLTPSITPPASNLLEQDVLDVATACLPRPALEHDGLIPTTLSPLPGTSWQPLVSSAADSAPITSPSIAKTSKLRVNKTSMTARNLAAAVFAKTHLNATTQDFAMHLNHLMHEELLTNETRHRFALAYTAKAPTATIDEVLHAFEMAPEDDIKTFREAVVTHAGKVKKTRVLKGKEKALQLGIDHR
ncbi:hypothetical protein BD414DRAFT_476955 [Trametes punicea]|nr:hypothetical protein BD414DRAFT_476955 [Trametes punicea]